MTAPAKDAVGALMRATADAEAAPLGFRGEPRARRDSIADAMREVVEKARRAMHGGTCFCDESYVCCTCALDAALARLDEVAK